MVDPVNGPGSLANIAASKSQGSNASNRKDEASSASGRRVEDEVAISSDALTLQQAEQALANARRQLATSDQALGLGPDFIREQLG
jgi:hypothetical protein